VEWEVGALKVERPEGVFWLLVERACLRADLRAGGLERVKRTSAHVWMPRHRPARKDVASCEKLRGAASGH
jgi:hypothetical protein